MDELLLPIAEEDWKKSPAPTGETSLMTSLGLIEGEVLTYLDEHGATTLKELVRQLEWPARMIMMAVGALIRERLVRATQREPERPALEATGRTEGWVETVPQV